MSISRNKKDSDQLNTEDTRSIEFTSPPRSPSLFPRDLYVPLLITTPVDVVIDIKDTKEQKSESKEIKIDVVDDIDLESQVKKKLMDRAQFRTLSDEARISVMGAIQIEMSTLQHLPADKLADALRHLILQNPVLRHQVERGEGRSIFVIQRRDWDNSFGRTITGLSVAACAINPCDVPFAFLNGGDVAGELMFCVCALAVVTCVCWATAASAISTCASPESSTTKALKLLLPVVTAVTVSLMMYRQFSESLGDWALEHHLSRGYGEVGGPLLTGWLTYLLTSCAASAKECVDNSQAQQEAIGLQNYFSAHPVDADVMTAVAESNIEKLLVQYQREGDNNHLVRAFSRAVLDEWILELEVLQNKHDKQAVAPKAEVMEDPAVARRL